MKYSELYRRAAEHYADELAGGVLGLFWRTPGWRSGQAATGRRGDEVGLGAGREVPGPACYLRGRIVGIGDVDADVATVRVHERQRLPGASRPVGFGEQPHARVEHIEDESCSGRQVSSNRLEAVRQVPGVVQMQQGVGLSGARRGTQLIALYL